MPGQSGLLDRVLPRRHRALFLLCATLSACGVGGLLVSMNSADLASTEVFASYWGSGWAASRGLDPYAPTPFTPRFVGNGLSVPELNLNPPLLLPLFQLLARLDLFDAARLLAIGSTLAFLLTAGRLLRDARAPQRRQVIWIFAAPAFLDTVSLGQIYVALMVLSAAAWLCLARGRATAAGLAIGTLVAIKPIFMLWPAVLWLAGHRRPAVVAVLMAVGLTASSLALYGPAVGTHWLAALASDHHALVPTDASLGGYLTRLGRPGFGLAAGPAVAIAACLWAWGRRPDVLDATALALAAAILASPLSWFHYTLVLVPALLRRPWGPVASGGALLLCVPVTVPLAALDHPGWGPATLGAVYVTGVLLIAVEILRNTDAPSTAGGCLRVQRPVLRAWHSTTGVASE